VENGLGLKGIMRGKSSFGFLLDLKKSDNTASFRVIYTSAIQALQIKIIYYKKNAKGG